MCLQVSNWLRIDERMLLAFPTARLLARQLPRSFPQPQSSAKQPPPPKAAEGKDTENLPQSEALAAPAGINLCRHEATTTGGTTVSIAFSEEHRRKRPRQVM